jgi:ATP-dependent RNA helicase DeaD
MPEGMKHLTKKYLKDPKEISAGKRNISASNVTHELYVVNAKNTYEAMRRIVDFNPNMYGIVFCRTRRETQSIAEKLVGDGYRAEAIHGDLSQAQRDDVMSRFRRKKLNVMVATDVAARGIDVNDLTHVINVNIPDDPEVYVHRSGRTGRAGASGISLVITHGRNMRKVKNLERIIGKKFEERTVPSGDDICGIKMKEAIDEIVSYEHTTTIDPQLLDVAMDKLAHLSKAELIERFVGHETSVMLSRYRGARDINEKASSPKEHGKRDRSTGREEGFKTVVIDLGYRQNVNPSRIMGLINDAMEGTKVRIGKIDMDKTFTKIDIEDRHAVEVAARLNGAKTGSYVVNSYFEEGSSSSRAERPSYGGRDRRDGGGYKGKRRSEGGADRREGRSGDRPVRRERISGERTERRERFSNDRSSSDRRSGGGFNRDDNRSGSRSGGSSRTGGSSSGGYGKAKTGGGYPKGRSGSAGKTRRSF